MTEAVREWAVTVCGASVFCAVVNLISPEEKYEKIIRLCLGLFMLLSIISPLSEIDFTAFELRNESAGQTHCEFESDFEDAVSQVTADAARDAIEKHLNDNGIYPEEISVTTDISESGCISIDRVVVQMNADSMQKTAVRLLLEGWLGIGSVEVTD